MKLLKNWLTEQRYHQIYTELIPMTASCGLGFQYGLHPVFALITSK